MNVIYIFNFWAQAIKWHEKKITHVKTKIIMLLITEVLFLLLFDDNFFVSSKRE